MGMHDFVAPTGSCAILSAKETDFLRNGHSFGVFLCNISAEYSVVVRDMRYLDTMERFDQQG